MVASVSDHPGLGRSVGEGVADIGEHVGQPTAHRGRAGDDDATDDGGDQAVFEGGDAAGVALQESQQPDNLVHGEKSFLDWSREHASAATYSNAADLIIRLLRTC